MLWGSLNSFVLWWGKTKSICSTKETTSNTMAVKWQMFTVKSWGISNNHICFFELLNSPKSYLLYFGVVFSWIDRDVFLCFIPYETLYSMFVKGWTRNNENLFANIFGPLSILSVALLLHEPNDESQKRVETCFQEPDKKVLEISGFWNVCRLNLHISISTIF